MHELQGQLKEREATLKQDESFVRQLDADNEELHRERAVVKRAEGAPS